MVARSASLMCWNLKGSSKMPLSAETAFSTETI